jgi:hypothetical protein
MNESVAEEESPLKALQDILHNRIMQKKGEIHEPHSEAYTAGSLSKWSCRGSHMSSNVSRISYLIFNIIK